jgi:hypothetical protein
MARKSDQKPRKSSDPEEYQRFLQAAREVEAEQDSEAFDRAFKRVVKPSTPRPK